MKRVSTQSLLVASCPDGFLADISSLTSTQVTLIASVNYNNWCARCCLSMALICIVLCVVVSRHVLLDNC